MKKGKGLRGEMLEEFTRAGRGRYGKQGWNGQEEGRPRADTGGGKSVADWEPGKAQ